VAFYEGDHVVFQGVQVLFHMGVKPT